MAACLSGMSAWNISMDYPADFLINDNGIFSLDRKRQLRWSEGSLRRKIPPWGRAQPDAASTVTATSAAPLIRGAAHQDLRPGCGIGLGIARAAAGHGDLAVAGAGPGDHLGHHVGEHFSSWMTSAPASIHGPLRRRWPLQRPLGVRARPVSGG
jgi:hypothetical protein